MIKLFQTSLFGYSKKSVHAYISEMNEDFSQKLLEKEGACKEAVQALREEVERLRQENEQLRGERQAVAGVLIDAKAFASGLMEQAEKENETRRSRNEALHQAEFQRIQGLASDIDRLREAFRAALRGMDEEMEQYGIKCQAIQTEFCPDRPEDIGGSAQQETRGGQENAG